ncbi:hypothetical protein BDA96_04G268200 [Sorghum bicolor]|uniref:Uncharacterized protein n=2 Tax=Sorghum bicolor TaxID=4558 RepID=C5XZV2_SORBI|nr:hypothetical protein SORBI_3004G251701 [Sorghum bicolor]KAG0534304.1 hypothetical protein BDA96_04G268200 [Sorghum bicolor]
MNTIVRGLPACGHACLPACLLLHKHIQRCSLGQSLSGRWPWCACIRHVLDEMYTRSLITRLFHCFLKHMHLDLWVIGSIGYTCMPGVMWFKWTHR